MTQSHRIVAALALLAGLGVGGRAAAQAAVFGPETLHGMAELSWGGANGEPSWTDGGFGKSAVGGTSNGHWKGHAGLSQAVLEWRPQFSFAASAVVSVQWQSDLQPRLDLDEAYLKLKAPPLGGGRLSGRLGVFYPPVSLEHTGVGWTTTDLISASAIDSWIGEEVKVGGAEATYERQLGDHRLAATAAVFGWNDTSGTLLSFRGWALHGLRAGPSSEFELPPLSPYLTPRQDEGTYPMWEIDHRAGYYGRLEWRPPAPLVLDAVYYDNRGDRTSVRALQWAWATHFLDLGLRWEPDGRTHLKAQALSGGTKMGYQTPTLWVDVDFEAAYLLATRDIGEDALTARLDGFQTRDRADRAFGDNTEHGWAATAGWRHHLTANADLLLEAQHIDSKRPSRQLAGHDPDQAQDVLQSALRLHF